MPIQCPKCKSLNRDMATVCASCGASLAVTSESYAEPSLIKAPPVLVPGEFPEPKSRPSGTAFVGYVIFLFVVIIFLEFIRSLNPYTDIMFTLFFTGITFLISFPIFWVVKRRKSWKEEVFRGQVIHMGARQVQEQGRRRQTTIDVWSFRLQRTDNDFQQLLRDNQRNLLAALPVEIRAQSISGPLQDGDKVEIRGHLIRGIFYVDRLFNFSAGGAELVMKEVRSAP